MRRILRASAVALGLAPLVCAAPPATAAAVPDPVEHVVVVGVAGLRWSDLNPADTPTLEAMSRSGATGSLSVRSAADVSCPGEGWLTLGSGSYAAVADPAGLEPDAGCAPRMPPPVTISGAPGGPATVPALPQLRELNTGLRFGARPGTLGAGLPCASAVGPGAALAVADPDGRVHGYRPTLPESPAELLGRCPATVVDLGAVDGPGSGQRRSQARQMDAALARIRTSLPPESVLMVFGLAETQAAQPHLHVAVAEGPGFDPGWLRSPSTHRVPYLQLVDVTPTVLAALGQVVPQDLAGRPLHGGGAGRPADQDAAIAMLVDTDTQAVAQRAVLGGFGVALGAALLAVVATAVWLLRRTLPDRTSRRAAGWLGVAALGLSAVPAASFLANLVPWWRASAPLPALGATVAAIALLMVAIAILAGRWVASWTARVRVRLGALAAITVLVFVVDAHTGAHLQLGSLLGYNPLVAGRFIGFGNIAFAVYAVAGVLLAAFLAYGRRRTAAGVAVAAVAVPVVVVDGMPWWGADFGGVITLVPAFVVLGLLVMQAQVTWRRLLLAAAGGVVLVLAISWLDYLRPPADRSHFGRFLVSAMDGSAVQIMRRKLLANLDLLVIGPHSILAAALLVVGVVLLIRPPPALQRVYHTWPVARTGLLAILVLAGFGFATNDSGVAIPSVMALVILPTVVALCVWVARGDPWHEPPAAASGRSGAEPAVKRPEPSGTLPPPVRVTTLTVGGPVVSPTGWSAC